MTDYLTIIECGIETPIVAYVGDGNNITHSWLMLSALLGFELRVATPDKYACDPKIVQEALELAKKTNAKISFGSDPKVAVEGANVVTTDTWVSMGQEDEKEERLEAFKGYIVDEELMSLAQENALFLHCLPAYRDYEVSEETFEKHADVIFLEAENRLHAQKGIMVWLDQHRNS